MKKRLIHRTAFSDIDRELDMMEDYVLTMRSALRKAHKEHGEKIRAKGDAMDPDDAQELYNDVAEDDIRLGDLFPALSSSSTFVAIMSFLEHQFVFICREVEEAHTGQDFIFAPRDSVLKKCREELQRRNITVPTDKLWNELLVLQKTRNAVVHQLGELNFDEIRNRKGRRYTVHEYLKRRDDASMYQMHVDGPYKVVLTHNFCLAAIDTVREFLRSVIALVPKSLYRKAVRER